MIIGDRLRVLRVQQKFSQGTIEQRTGLLRCYVSRVENGHSVPAIETLEKFARALEVPMYQLFYDGEEPPKLPNLPKRITADEIAWGSSGEGRSPAGEVSPPAQPGVGERFEAAASHGPEDGGNKNQETKWDSQISVSVRRTRLLSLAHE